MHQQVTQASQAKPMVKRPMRNRCLIIEDSEFDSQKMARVIDRNMNNMDVAIATTLSSAREALDKRDFSLILLDNNLPDGLGADFVQELAMTKRLSNIPVIMVSDWPSPFMWEKAASAGVHYVLNKKEFDAHYILSALQQTKPPRARVS